MAIYRKGDDQFGLEKRSDEQRMQEIADTSKLTSEQKFNRDVRSGVQGAKNIVTYNVTAKEAAESPVMFGGPVSGSALAKLKKK